MDSQKRVVVAAMVTASAAVAHHVVGKATRDTLFLSTYAVGNLPAIMMASAAVSLVMMVLLGRALTVYGPRRIAPLLFFISAVASVAEWILLRRAAGVMAVLVYFHVTVFGAMAMSAFWSLVNERFDPRTARRRITRIATGGTVGGIVGGLLAFSAARVLGAHHLLCVLAALHAVAGFAAATVGDHRVVEPHRPATSVLATLRGAPFLRHLGIVVALAAVIDALFDFMLGAQASKTFGGAQLLSFFALYHTSVGVLTFGAQLFIAQRLLRRLGATGAVTLLPTIVIVVTTVAMQLPRLLTIALLRGMTSVVGNSLWRSGYELLFTPVAPSHKRATKILIDVGFDRLGTAAGALLALVSVTLVPHLAVSVLLRVAIIVGVIALLFASRLRTGYVAALERGLSAAPAVSHRLESLDREQLLQEVEQLRTERLLTTPEEETEVLSERDEDTTRKLLESGVLDRRAVVRVIDLVGHPSLHGAAIAALRRVVDEHAGAIVDALLAPRTPFDVRRRLPRVLARSSQQRALDGLVDALDDARFDVRREAGLALVQVVATHPCLIVPRDRVLKAVEREIAADRAVWDVEPPLEGDELEVTAPFLDRMVRDRTERSLEHIFALLSLVYGRDPMQLALQALYSNDERLRGTALEYLDTVLPRALRDVLWPYVGDRARPARATSPRTRKALLEALLRSGPLDVPRPLDE